MPDIAPKAISGILKKMSDEKKGGSAYREFRDSAYRNRYLPALIFGARNWTYGQLLERIEQAYNTFRQMRIQAGERVCLWLPNCPDLICAFYALSRLGAVGVLCHGQTSPAEVCFQMEKTGAERLMTTVERYDRFCKNAPPLGAGRISLCRPEKDMRGAPLSAYRRNLRMREREDKEEVYWDQQTARNQYHSGDAASQTEQEAVVLFSTSSFEEARPITYLPEELCAANEAYGRRWDGARRIYIEISMANEGGFLAIHSAFCAAKEILLAEEEKVEILRKYHPDLVVGTEELFWELRLRAKEFGGRWENLQGGILIGKEISPLMEKYTPMAFLEMGGKGELSRSPIPLKMQEESLYYIRDFGIRLEAVARRVETLEEVERCRCLPESGGLKLQIAAKKGASKNLSAKIASFCRMEMGALHRPKKIEYNKF